MSTYAHKLAGFRATTKAIKAVLNGLELTVKTGEFLLGTHVEGKASELAIAAERLAQAGYESKIVHSMLLQVWKNDASN